MSYKKLSEKEGQKYLRKIETIVLTKKKDFFVEPFTNRGLRYRCFFKKDSKKGFIIYLHLTKDEVFKDLTPKTKVIYLYGAYNRVTVCQMRTYGTIRLATEKERQEFMALVTARLSSIETEDFLKIPEKEASDAHILLEKGNVYCFFPTSYSYKTYERG